MFDFISIIFFLFDLMLLVLILSVHILFALILSVYFLFVLILSILVSFLIVESFATDENSRCGCVKSLQVFYLQLGIHDNTVKSSQDVPVNDCPYLFRKKR